MSGPAPVETGNRIRVITTPRQVDGEAAEAISGQLAQTDHPRDPKQVSAQGEADQVLRGIAEANSGAEVADITHDLKRLAGQTFEEGTTGTDYINSARKGSGLHRIPLERVSKMVKQTGIAQRLRHILFGDTKKKAV